MGTQNSVDYAMELIKEGQGFEENAYKDTEGYWTIGIGHKLLPH